jgi:hypothetical protein
VPNAKKTADDARLVVTLNFKMDKRYRDQYPAHRRDAIDVLRLWTDNLQGCSKEELKRHLDQLIDQCENFTLDAAK